MCYTCLEMIPNVLRTELGRVDAWEPPCSSANLPVHHSSSKLGLLRIRAMEKPSGTPPANRASAPHLVPTIHAAPPRPSPSSRAALPPLPLPSPHSASLQERRVPTISGAEAGEASESESVADADTFLRALKADFNAAPTAAHAAAPAAPAAPAQPPGSSGAVSGSGAGADAEAASATAARARNNERTTLDAQPSAPSPPSPQQSCANAPPDLLHTPFLPWVSGSVAVSVVAAGANAASARMLQPVKGAAVAHDAGTPPRTARRRTAPSRSPNPPPVHQRDSCHRSRDWWRCQWLQRARLC